MPVREINPVKDAFEQHTGIKLGRSLYQGDGEVFALKGQPGRLVKVVWTDSAIRAAQRMKMLQYLCKSKNGAVVNLHKVGQYEVIKYHQLTKVPYTEYYYYYVMDKLKQGVKAREVYMIERVLGGDYLPPDAPSRVKSFIKKARQLKYNYTDFHEWNILKSKRGAFKFIDLESFTV